MALITEYFNTRPDGIVLNRTFSDLGYKIEREGILYNEAIDPSESNRVYIETLEPVDIEEEEQQEASILDYQKALEELGVIL